jgi:hypothetical protein
LTIGTAPDDADIDSLRVVCLLALLSFVPLLACQRVQRLHRLNFPEQ